MESVTSNYQLTMRNNMPAKKTAAKKTAKKVVKKSVFAKLVSPEQPKVVRKASKGWGDVVELSMKKPRSKHDWEMRQLDKNKLQ